MTVYLREANKKYFRCHQVYFTQVFTTMRGFPCISLGKIALIAAASSSKLASLKYSGKKD